MKTSVSKFDTAEYLDSEDMIVAYLSEAITEGDNEVLLNAIGNIAKARGMKKIAEESGLGRESLYKAFAPGAKPRFETVLKVLKALGVSLDFKSTNAA
jgi:probable addiction module antidote protein